MRRLTRLTLQSAPLAMCRLEVCGYTRTREYGSGRVDALRVHHTITNIACWNLRRKSRNSSSGDTDVTWAENQDAETGNTIQTRLPRDIAALSRSCIVCGRKCWARLTWYHFAAAFLHPVYREHDSLKSNSMEHKLHRVRLDMKGMVASLEDKALGAPPKKQKRRAVLLPSSVCLWHLRQWEPTRLRHGWVHIVYHALPATKSPTS